VGAADGVQPIKTITATSNNNPKLLGVYF